MSAAKAVYKAKGKGVVNPSLGSLVAPTRKAPKIAEQKATTAPKAESKGVVNPPLGHAMAPAWRLAALPYGSASGLATQESYRGG